MSRRTLRRNMAHAPRPCDERRIVHAVRRLVDQPIEQRQLCALQLALHREWLRLDHAANRSSVRSMMPSASSPTRNTRWPTPRTGSPSSPSQSVACPRRSHRPDPARVHHKSPEHRPHRRGQRSPIPWHAARRDREAASAGEIESIATRSVGTQKYLPVVVSTSKNPAHRSSTSRKSSNA